MASRYIVEAQDESDYSKRAAYLLEYKLNQLFERQFCQIENEQLRGLFLKSTLRRLTNKHVVFLSEQLNATEFFCTRELLSKPGQVDQFTITFEVMEDSK